MFKQEIPKPKEEEMPAFLPPELMTPEVVKALKIAAEKHQRQAMKSDSATPYLEHLSETAQIVARYTSEPAILAAALLHDTLEDTDYTFEELVRDFGPEVASIVKEVTEDKMPGLDKKLTWQERKDGYLANLSNDQPEALLVCAADKINGLARLIRDYQRFGEAVWKNFNAPKDRRLWFYGQVLKILQEKLGSPIVTELETVYERAKELIAGEAES